MNGAIDHETVTAPTTPSPIVPASDTAAIPISAESDSRVPSGRPFSSSSAWALRPTARKNAPSVAASRPPCSVGAATAPSAT